MENLPSPGLIDVAVLALVALAALRGFFRGFARELAGFLTVVAAMWLGMRLHAPCGAWLAAHSRLPEQAAQACAFGVLVVLGLVFILLARWLLGKVIRVVVDERFDRPLGGIAGALGGVALALILLVAALLVPHPPLNALCAEQSFLGALVQRSLPRMQEWMEGVPGIPEPAPIQPGSP